MVTVFSKNNFFSQNIVVASLSPLTERVIGLLETTGAHVYCTDSGRNAIDYLVSTPCLALVTDYSLLDIDIWAFSTMIRSGRFCQKSLPIIVIHDDEEPNLPDGLSRDYVVDVLSVDAIETLPDFIQQALSRDHKPRVLIIEDDDTATDVAQCALEEAYTVDTCTNGETGLQKWSTVRHDIVVLDLMLPGMNGAEVLDQIVAMNTTQAVIITTAHSQLENHRDLVIAGASEFLSKPFKPNALRKACRIAYNKARLLAEAQGNANRFSQISESVSAARQALECGDYPAAKAHLDGLTGVLPGQQRSEDDWTALIAEFV